jgi:hypothetical protein
VSFVAHITAANERRRQQQQQQLRLTRSHSRPRSAPLSLPDSVCALGAAFKAGSVAQVLLSAGALSQAAVCVPQSPRRIHCEVRRPVDLYLSLAVYLISGFTSVPGRETLHARPLAFRAFSGI